MGKPAARVKDMHTCPMVSPGGVPHVGGPVKDPGSSSVFIEGEAAAVVGDSCECEGAVDYIVSGSASVFIGGKPAARKGDRCIHGGELISGSGTVFIGGRTVRIKIEIQHEEFVEPSEEEKARLIEQAIKDCIALLERKLALMESGDPETMEAFKKWFGRDDGEAVKIILDRIRRALDVSRGLTLKNFEELVDEKEKRETCAISYPNDDQYRIKVGIVFWEAGAMGKDSKAGSIAHELSHFESIGSTEDETYGEKDSLKLAEDDPKGALNNASSFELFIVT